MKRTIILLICMLTVLSVFCVVASAESMMNNTLTIETENTHFTVRFNSGILSEEQQKIVAEKLVFGDNNSSAHTYGLGCTLFGHDYLYDTVYVTSHKVAATAPRCKEDCYDVKYCEDCDFLEQTWRGSKYIYCCN